MGIKTAFPLVLVTLMILGAITESHPPLPETRHKRADDSNPLQAVVDNLVQKTNDHEAKITALQNKLDSYSRVVAFDVHAGGSPVSALANGPIILTQVQTNTGGGYDTTSGLFTAPVTGTYFFHATFLDHTQNDQTWAGIYVDGKRVAYSTSDTRHGYWDAPAIMAVVHVRAGQTVSLRNTRNQVITYFPGMYTTFSGALIRAD